MVLHGRGIDPTGARDRRAAIQRLLDSCPAHGAAMVPPGATIAVRGSLVIRRAITVLGPGELVWIGGIEHAAAIDVRADRSSLLGLRLTARGDLGASTGGASFALRISADAVQVIGCRVAGFQNGIAVAADGEFHDIVVADNEVLDIRGAGGGRGSSSTAGEDRGDGIVVWDSAVSVSGNRVTAATGTDARIGIHVEALSDYVRTPGTLNASSCAITGNVVSGPFRRGIADDGVSNSTITGNTVSDSTWWALSLSGDARSCAMTGNAIRWTRTSADDQGAAWTPLRAAIMVCGAVRGAAIVGNCVQVLAGAALPSVIAVQAPDLDQRSQSVVVSGTVLTAEPGTTDAGIRVVGGSLGTELRGNVLNGLQLSAARFEGADGLVVSDSSFTVIGRAGSGIVFAGAAVAATDLVGNRITGVGIGIQVGAAIRVLVIQHNRIVSSEVGADLSIAGTTVSAANTFIGPRAFRGAPPKSLHSSADTRIDA